MAEEKLITTDSPLVVFEDNAVGRMKKEVWEVTEKGQRWRWKKLIEEGGEINEEAVEILIKGKCEKPFGIGEEESKLLREEFQKREFHSKIDRVKKELE